MPFEAATYRKPVHEAMAVRAKRSEIRFIVASTETFRNDVMYGECWLKGEATGYTADAIALQNRDSRQRSNWHLSA
jgi:hypothetical protein